jgi:phosphoglycerol transferase
VRVDAVRCTARTLEVTCVDAALGETPQFLAPASGCLPSSVRPMVSDAVGSDVRAGSDQRTDTSARAPSHHPTRARFGAIRPLLEGGLVGALALGIAAWLLKVWERSLSIPFYGDPDVQFVSEIVKTIDRHGWYLQNPDVGAPFGQQLYDFPHAGETLQLAAIRVMSLFTDRFGLIVNAYYLLGFAVLAAVTYVVLRQLRFSRSISAAIALLYTFLPYHFAHGEGHLFRSSYFSAPLAALVIIWILSFRASFLTDPDGALWPWRSLRAHLRWRMVAAATLCCVVIGLSETMMIAFTMTAIAATCLLVALRDRSLAQAIVGILAVFAIGCAFAAALLPNLLYWHEHGTNPKTGHRLLAEQEMFGLRISQMLLPSDSHRLPAARDLTGRTNERSPLSTDEGGQALGLIGVCGFVVAIGALLTRGVPRRSRAGVEDRSQLLRHSGLAALVLVLFGTVSGLAILLDLIGFAQIRVWNRVVVVIAMFAMIVVAIGLEKLRNRIARRPSSRTISAMGILALVVFGLWDTTGQLPAVPSTYPLVEHVRAFDGALEHRLPHGAALFQLPVWAFPEVPPSAKMRDYDEFLPYLWSEGLRWSYGATKGRRDADWQQRVNSNDPTSALAGLRGLGFDGVVVDIAGYPDRGTKVTTMLTAALGPPEITSPVNARWRFWDLRGYEDSADLTHAQLRAAARKLVGAQITQIRNAAH